jgi:hypothetical protein
MSKAYRAVPGLGQRLARRFTGALRTIIHSPD